MQYESSACPADNREETYRLLAACSPARVVVDTSLAMGAWYVVRAPNEEEMVKLRESFPRAFHA